ATITASRMAQNNRPMPRSWGRVGKVAGLIGDASQAIAGPLVRIDTTARSRHSGAYSRCVALDDVEQILPVEGCQRGRLPAWIARRTRPPPRRLMTHS